MAKIPACSLGEGSGPEILYVHNGDHVIFKRRKDGNSMAVQWLELCAFTAEGLGSIPGGGTKILQAVQSSQINK